MNEATSFTRRGQGWPAVCPPVAPAWPSAEQVVLVDGCLVLAVLEEVTVKRVSGVQRKRQSRGLTRGLQPGMSNVILLGRLF